MTDYKSYSNQSDRYKNAYKKRLDTYNRIQNVIATSYASDNNIVSHYLKNDESVPIWAIFEIITLGEFGNLISTFELNTRKNISKDLGLNVAFDSSGKLVENIIFLVKDLRNAIAHNNVVFDTRFRQRNINKTLLKALCQDTKIQGINFTSITDYIVLVVYILKKLSKNNKELLKIINDFIKIVDNLKQNIPQSILNQIVLTNDLQKLQILKSFLKK